MCRLLQALSILLLALLGAAAAAQAADPTPTPPPDAGQAGDMAADDSLILETPAFPGAGVRRALRMLVESRFVPDQDLGPGHTSLYRPDLAGRLTVPFNDRAVLRFEALGGLSRYEFRGGDPLLFGNVSLTGDSLHLYRTRLTAQGAYRMNDEGSFLIRDGEVWSLLGGLFAGSEFESGAFDDGVSGGGIVALGYEMDGKLRVSAGVSLSTSIEGGGVDVNPTGSFHWHINENLTLRDRGLGIQLDYRVTPSIELYASGFRTSDEFSLRDVRGAPDDLTLRDRQILVGGGFEWKLSRHLRLNTEAGAVTWRRLRVKADGPGTIASQRGDPTPYFEVRLEIRP